MQRALEGLPGMRQVILESGSDTLMVTSAIPLDDEELRRAVQGEVVFPWLRSLLARLWHIAMLFKSVAR